MDQDDLRAVLDGVSKGSVSVDEAVLRIKMAPFEDLGFAKVDSHRGVRQGIPEIVFGAGKTPEQILAILDAMMDSGERSVLITRLSELAASRISEYVDLDYDPVSRIGIVGKPRPERIGKVMVMTAGTSDIPVAEEAAITAEALGNNVIRAYDVGVAGVHRLLAYSEDIMTSRAIVAVAGMEGALASVVGGIADCPVIAVPTSVGYGASFGGVAALLAMLNSCASGVSVVNIDNGFGAGYLASVINHTRSPDQ